MAAATVVGEVATGSYGFTLAGTAGTLLGYSASALIAAKSTALLGFTTGATSTGLIALGSSLGASSLASIGLAGTSATATTAMGALATALLVTSGFGGLAAASGVSVGSAWLAAAGAVASAMVGMIAPILPFVAIAGAAVVAVTAVGAAAAFVAVKGIEFAKGWSIATGAFGQSVGIIKQVAAVLSDALEMQNYQVAAQGLWLGLKAIFWTGAQATVDAFKWAWSQAWSASSRFFMALLDISSKVGKALVMNIINPFGTIGRTYALMNDIAASMANVSNSMPNFAANAVIAQNELRAFMGKTEELRKQNELLKEQKSISERMAAGESPEAIAKSRQQKADEALASGKMTRFEYDSVTDTIQSDMRTQKKRQREEVQQQLESGEITPGQARKRLAEIDNLSQAYSDMVTSLELEVMALEQGEKAAQRKKLADEGLTEQQIKDVEALQDKKKALEDMKAAQEKAMAQRVEGVFNIADQLAEGGLNPAEIFRRTMNQIGDDEKKGILGKQAADDARERARGDLQTRLDAIKEEGKRLAEAMRTPAEILADENKRIDQLQQAGAIDANVAKRAKDKAQEDFNNATKKAEDINANVEQARFNGPTGTFSSFSLMNGAFGGQVNYQKEIAWRVERHQEAHQGKANCEGWLMGLIDRHFEDARLFAEQCDELADHQLKHAAWYMEIATDNEPNGPGEERQRQLFIEAAGHLRALSRVLKSIAASYQQAVDGHFDGQSQSE